MKKLSKIQMTGLCESESIESGVTLFVYETLKNQAKEKPLSEILLMCGLTSAQSRKMLGQIIGLPWVNLKEFPDDESFLIQVHSMLSIC